MDDDKVGWKKFKRIQLDRKQLLRRAKKMEGATQRHAHRFVIRRLDNIKSVSREITTWLLLVGAIIVGIGVQLYWGQTGYMTDAAARGGTYVEGVVGSIETLNPLFASTNSEASLSRLMFSSLYNYDETGSLHQDLATGMKIDETNKIYTVTIRDNVKWHDNTPLTARDIAFTLELVKNPAARSPLRVNWLDVSVKAVDNKTVQFILPATYAAFPYALTFPVLPEHLLKDIAPGAVRESAYSQSPVGSGPFRFRLLQQPDVVSQHKVVHLVANSKYYLCKSDSVRQNERHLSTLQFRLQPQGQRYGVMAVIVTLCKAVFAIHFVPGGIPADPAAGKVVYTPLPQMTAQGVH